MSPDSKRFSLYFTLVIVVSFTISYFSNYYFLSWIFCGLAGYMLNQGNLKGYLLGFGTHTLLWSAWAGFQNFQNKGLLATKIGELFGGVSHPQLVALVGLIGGVGAGLFGLAGAAWRSK